MPTHYWLLPPGECMAKAIRDTAVPLLCGRFVCCVCHWCVSTSTGVDRPASCFLAGWHRDAGLIYVLSKLSLCVHVSAPAGQARGRKLLPGSSLCASAPSLQAKEEEKAAAKAGRTPSHRALVLDPDILQRVLAHR